MNPQKLRKLLERIYEIRPVKHYDNAIHAGFTVDGYGFSYTRKPETSKDNIPFQASSYTITTPKGETYEIYGFPIEGGCFQVSDMTKFVITRDGEEATISLLGDEAFNHEGKQLMIEIEQIVDHAEKFHVADIQEKYSKE